MPRSAEPRSEKADPAEQRNDLAQPGVADQRRYHRRPEPRIDEGLRVLYG